MTSRRPRRVTIGGRLVAVGLTAALAAVGLVAGSVPAGAAACPGKTTNWLVGAGDGNWTNDANWDAGAPADGDAAVVPAGATVTGATGTVCSLAAAGSIAVTGTLTVTGALDTAAGTAFSFADGAGLTLSGSGHLADGVLLGRPASATGLTPQVRVGGPLSLDGTTTSDRVGVVLAAGGSITSGSTAGTLTGTGSLSWQGGTFGGVLTIGTPLVASGGADLQTMPDSALTLAGATTLSATRVLVGAHTTVTIGGSLTLSGTPVGFGRSGSTVDGQQLVVAAGAALQRFGTGSDPAVLDLPVVNHGAVTVAGRLEVPLGFLQQTQKGAADPVTGLLSSTSVLSTVNAVGHYGTVRIDGGGLGGVGSVAARRVTIGAGWVHPGFSDAAGALTLFSDLVLSAASDVQLYVRGKTADKRDTLHVQGLSSHGTPVASGRATLSGSISALTGPGYSPSYGTTAPAVLTYAARTGHFTVPVHPITPTGLGWKPRYDDTLKGGRGVGLRLLDVQGPTVGLAGVAAFTQRTSQQLTYEAVDNRSGVATFDVRWRSGSPGHAFSAWHSPRSWRHTTDRGKTLHGLAAGRTYCFAVRARDNLGNRSSWGTPQCTARMLDDHALTAAGGWTRGSGQGFYGGTFSRSSARGATLSRHGVVNRVAVTAVRCPACGTLGIYLGGTLVKTMNLHGSGTTATTWVSKPRKPAAVTVSLRVLSSGKPVAVDAVGLAR
jgi:hypothetical protein